MEMTIAVFKCSVTHLRIVGGAFLNTLCSCLFLFGIPIPGRARIIVGCFVGFLILFAFIFPGRKIRIVTQLAMVYLLMHILLGGTIALIRKLTGIPIGTIHILIGTGGVAIILKFITTILKRDDRDVGCEVSLGYRGKEVKQISPDVIIVDLC